VQVFLEAGSSGNRARPVPGLHAAAGTESLEAVLPVEPLTARVRPTRQLRRPRSRRVRGACSAALPAARALVNVCPC